MAIPRIKELYNPILGYLLERRKDTLVSIRKAMQEYFYISEEDAFTNAKHEGKYTLFEWRVNTACNNLYHAGLLNHPYKGVYAISDIGCKIADSEKDVDRDFLWNIKDFREFSRSKRETKTEFDDKYEDLNKIGKKEYVEIEEVTVAHVIELKKQDTRFANMMAVGLFMLEDGQIRDVPIEVLQHDMSLQEHRDTTLSHGASNSAFVCKTAADASGRMKAVRNRQAIPGGVGSRPRKWENPDPFVKTSFDNAMNNARRYKGFSSIKDAMHQLINIDYKISYAELSRRTGISEDKLRNMCTSSAYNPKFLDLAAIFIKLQVTPLVCKTIFSLAGYDVSMAKYEKHYEIIELGMHFTAPEINDMCQKQGIDTIFPATIKD